MENKNFYRTSEERYRGSRELISSRLEVYLPFLVSFQGSGSTCPLLDLGCGRGEWFVLMTEKGFSPAGFDLDEGMQKACAERRLPAERKDPLSALKADARVEEAEIRAAQAEARAEEAERKASEATIRAESNGEMLTALLASRSWRMTAPYRALGEGVKKIRKGSARGINFFLEKLTVIVLARPYLKTLARAILGKFPKAAARLRGFHENSRQRDYKEDHVNPSAGAKRIYAELKAEIERQKQEKR